MNHTVDQMYSEWASMLRGFSKMNRRPHVIRTLTISMLLLSLITQYGCMGQVMRNAATGEKFSDLRASLPSPADKHGRLFVYLTTGGANAWNTYGDEDYCTVDSIAYRILGETFWYLDLPSGEHRITATGVQNNFLRGKPRYLGENSLDVEIREGESIYVHMNKTGLYQYGTWTPVIVDAETAEKEMATLDFLAKFETGITVD